MAPPPAPPVPSVPGEGRIQRFELRDDGANAPEQRRQVRRYVFRDRRADAPQHYEFQGWGAPNDPEYQRKMAEWSKQMAKWGERYGKQMQKWGEKQGEQVRRFALARPFPTPVPAVPQPPAVPHAFAAPVPPAAALAPQVIENCNGQNGVSTSVLPGGRHQVVICAQAVRGRALEGLRGARERIAHDSGLTEDLRTQILQELDDEIEQQSQPEDKDDDADE